MRAQTISKARADGKKAAARDGLLDIQHVTAQGIVAGANMVLVDFHPKPEEALCGGPQALTLDELELFVRDAELVRTYTERVKLCEGLGK